MSDDEAVSYYWPALIPLSVFVGMTTILSILAVVAGLGGDWMYALGIGIMAVFTGVLTNVLIEHWLLHIRMFSRAMKERDDKMTHMMRQFQEFAREQRGTKCDKCGGEIHVDDSLLSFRCENGCVSAWYLPGIAESGVMSKGVSYGTFVGPKKGGT